MTIVPAKMTNRCSTNEQFEIVGFSPTGTANFMSCRPVQKRKEVFEFAIKQSASLIELNTLRNNQSPDSNFKLMLDLT